MNLYFSVYVAKKHREGAGTRHSSYRNRGSQSGTSPAAQLGHMAGQREQVGAAARSVTPAVGPQDMYLYFKNILDPMP